MPAIFVPVPKASMNKYSKVPRRKNDIGRARQVLSVKPKPQSHGVSDPAHL
jgi:hypothetical protein